MTEEITGTAEDPGTEAAASGDSADPGVAAERDRLARLLRETRLQLTMTQARLAALEQSATLELGRTLVRAARRPWPRGAQLPRDLYRMWRTGGAGQAGLGTTPAMLALASAQLGDLAGGGERLLSALTAPGLSALTARDEAAPGLAVTGVLTARACATLAPEAAVHPLLPHDADIMLESCGADLVIIEAAALLAGSAWAYAVDPAGADRGRRLARLIAAARALGKPVVFVRDIPAHRAPGLDWVAASCDVVTDEGLGVQLATFNPIALPLVREGRPLYAAARDQRESPAVRALLDAVTGGVISGTAGVRVSGEIPWRRLPALYRAHAVFLTASAEQADEQRACGARVIMADGGEEGLRRRLAEAAVAGPPDWPQIVAGLRDAFESTSTAARLGVLAGAAGLPGGMIPVRRIAVLARAANAGEAQALGASVLRQRLRPAELVVCAGQDEVARRAVSTALSPVAAHGVHVQAITGDDRAWARECAARAGSPWVAPWDGGQEYAGTHLLDLACARECAQADAVGHAGVTYAYTTSIGSPGLARRELLGSRALDVRGGLRLFSVS